MLDRETVLPVRSAPDPAADPIYNYEPTARGIRSHDKPTTIDGVRWLPVETPNGNGWIHAHYVTSDVAIGEFIEDERPIAIVEELTHLLDNDADFTHLLGERGLAIAVDVRPVLIPRRRVAALVSQQDDGPVADIDFHNLVAAPLGSALLDLAHISPRTTHSRSALIPVELWNFPYLAIQAPGHRPWLLYFEYLDGKPVLVGVGIDE